MFYWCPTPVLGISDVPSEAPHPHRLCSNDKASADRTWQKYGRNMAEIWQIEQQKYKQSN
jgi:hypothetical protein